jgi:hypothetical protein
MLGLKDPAYGEDYAQKQYKSYNYNIIIIISAAMSGDITSLKKINFMYFS